MPRPRSLPSSSEARDQALSVPSHSILKPRHRDPTRSPMPSYIIILKTSSRLIRARHSLATQDSREDLCAPVISHYSSSCAVVSSSLKTHTLSTLPRYSRLTRNRHLLPIPKTRARSSILATQDSCVIVTSSLPKTLTRSSLPRFSRLTHARRFLLLKTLRARHFLTTQDSQDPTRSSLPHHSRL